MNLSNKDSLENNKKLFLSAKEFADTLKSSYIILHPGITGSIEETISQIKGLKDNRIVLENKPLLGLNGEVCVGSTPEEISLATKATGCGFCLDIGHAICSANSHKTDPIKYINRFLTLAPAIYHMSDGNFSGEKDEHLHFGKGSYPLENIIKLLPDNAQTTIETPKTSSDNMNDFTSDIEYIRNIKHEYA
jgi:endonuclease IV